eukprot:COSAG01_NODE_8588_length_2728_cov_2.749912_1_plen_71_part_00
MAQVSFRSDVDPALRQESGHGAAGQLAAPRAVVAGSPHSPPMPITRRWRQAGGGADSLADATMVRTGDTE